MLNIYFECYLKIHACQYNEGKSDICSFSSIKKTLKVLSHSNLIKSSFLNAFYIEGVKISIVITIMRQKAEFTQLNNVFWFQLRNVLLLL